MKLLSVVTAVSLSVGMLSIAVVAAPPTLGFGQKPAAVPIRWQSDLRAAHRQAVAENKPIMIVFGAEWCGFCKKLEKQTLETPQMSQYINESFIPVHLDLDKEKRIGEILEVEALPCTIILSPNADLLGRIDGYHKPDPFHQKLAAARASFTTVRTAADAAPARK
ncbi:thioredoxin family protein [Planctomicrobium sp. SH664]|uniref:thioredoxin family protein n=1 Tax=Planctomicrobium sp. SH664 TaxID=3448125 RepID=UPI003F5C59F3